MSILLQKSEQNQKAASVLFDNSLYASSVHCRYYSCIQKIIHILEKYYTKEYKAKMASVKGGKGNSHTAYITEFSGQLSRFSREDARDVRAKLFDLRNYRIKSDYKEDEITKAKAEDATFYSNRVHALIKSHLEI